ncbi:MAG: MFS transporter [Eubacteriales bacterium]
MRNFFLSSLTTPPRDNKSLAAQLGYCFVVILIILIVISMTITSAYTSVLEQDRSDALQTTAVTSALAISHTALQEGMKYPMPASTYIISGHIYAYIVNIYTKAGNSFLRVYTSTPADTTSSNQYTLDGAGDEYRKAFEMQEVVVTSRSDKTGSYVAGVAPVIGVEGTVSGLVEVLMPESDFHAAEHGLSLSWIFTMFSIAAALSIIYFETHKLLTTMLGQPDRQLPKIIRYGLSGCQSISFFSAMACSMPPLVIASYILSASKSWDLPSNIPAAAVILFGGFLFASGFFGFSTLRMLFVRRFTTRISLIISIFAAFVLLLVSSVFSNIYLYLLLLLPTGFCLGMVFYFQREYRIYASRLGYDEFSERVIHNTQYAGYLLGACVGAVLSGIIFERFGLLAVSVICGSILLIVGIQALLFVQHCPPSSSPPLHLPNFLYALTSKKSGTFIWSCITTSGVQLAFYFIFLPFFLNRLGLSLATISFYFLLFSFVGSILVKSLLKLFPNRLNMQGRILISAILQVAGLLVLSLMPTAKALVLTVILMGAALGLHEFRLLDFYKEMIREDKQALAREILERGFAGGVILGSVGYGLLFLFENMRLALLLFTLVMAVLLFAYPLVTLLYTPVRPNSPVSHQEPPFNGPGDPFAQYQEVPDYGNPQQHNGMTSPPAENDYQAEYPGQETQFYNENRLYGQNRFNTGNPDEREGDNRR